MPDPVVDLNTFVGSGEVQHIVFGDPHSFLELKIFGPAGAVLFISVHVPLGLLRTLYTLDRGTKVLVRGELAFIKGDRPQHVIKAVALDSVAPGGWLLDTDAAPTSGHVAPLSVVPSVGAQASRQKRRRKRRARPEGHR